MGIPRFPLSLVMVGLIAGAACIRKPAAPAEMTIHLNSGIRNFVSLGDNEGDLRRLTDFPFVQEDIPADPESRSLRAVEVSHLFFYRDLGTKVYFRKGRVVLIEVQEPFKGSVQGKNLKVFQFENPQAKTWGETLERELGNPVARGTGGRFGAEALFYTWGDISFNKNGPNEIAVYDDPAISQYRQRNFGREIRLFQ